MMAQQKIESFFNTKRLRFEAKNEDDPDDENSGDNNILPSKGQAGSVKKDHVFRTWLNARTQKIHDMHDLSCG